MYYWTIQVYQTRLLRVHISLYYIYMKAMTEFFSSSSKFSRFNATHSPGSPHSVGIQLALGWDLHSQHVVILCNQSVPHASACEWIVKWVKTIPYLESSGLVSSCIEGISEQLDDTNILKRSTRLKYLQYKNNSYMYKQRNYVLVHNWDVWSTYVLRVVAGSLTCHIVPLHDYPQHERVSTLHSIAMSPLYYKQAHHYWYIVYMY